MAKPNHFLGDDRKMWYVIWVSTGREKITKKAIEHCIDNSLYNRLSIPHVVKCERRQGVDIRIVKRLMPSYMFVETDSIEEFAHAIRYMPGFSVVLKGDEYEPLSKLEEHVLLQLIKDGDIIDVSKGFMENDEITITAGPLIGLEGVIKFVNRRKRLAVIEMEMFNRKTSIPLSVEIVKKRKY